MTKLQFVSIETPLLIAKNRHGESVSSFGECRVMTFFDCMSVPFRTSNGWGGLVATRKRLFIAERAQLDRIWLQTSVAELCQRLIAKRFLIAATDEQQKLTAVLKPTNRAKRKLIALDKKRVTEPGRPPSPTTELVRKLGTARLNLDRSEAASEQNRPQQSKHGRCWQSATAPIICDRFDASGPRHIRALQLEPQ